MERIFGDRKTINQLKNKTKQTHVGIVDRAVLPAGTTGMVAIPDVVHTHRRRRLWPEMGLGDVRQCIGQ